jgi:ketosteroid isomerase-like protein
MSQENVEVVRRHHEAFIRGDREGTLQPLHPEVEFVFRAGLDLPTAHGHAELDKAMRQWLGTWRRESYRFEAREYRDIGHRVLVRCFEHGLGRESGVEVTRELFQVWDVRNGKAIRCEVFEEQEEALEAVGLRE